MPKYRVTYFNAKGLAEATRIALCAAGQTFEDRRLTSEEWGKLKPDIPQGQLPMLEVDGKIVGQSGAMIRFVGREHGLYGDGNLESTAVDTVLETMGDLLREMFKLFTEKDEEKKKELLKEFGETTIPKFVAVFCKMLCDNGGDYIVGTKLTIADILLYQRFAGISDFLGPEAAKSFLENDKLKAHSERVAAYPGIKEWIEKRPKTER